MKSELELAERLVHKEKTKKMKRVVSPSWTVRLVGVVGFGWEEHGVPMLLLSSLRHTCPRLFPLMVGMTGVIPLETCLSLCLLHPPSFSISFFKFFISTYNFVKSSAQFLISKLSKTKWLKFLMHYFRLLSFSLYYFFL